MARLEIERPVEALRPTVAVREVSLDVRDGEFLVLLGPSGCGKTTTLRMIAGFIAPTAGRVRLGGADVTALPPWKRNAGMVFQSYALFPHLTVAENVAFGLEMRKVPKREIAPRVTEALRLVRLEGLSERLPRQLSGGQQQRVALARALVIRPDVLLLDEPLSNLDAKLRETVRVEIRELQHAARHHHGDGHARPGGGADHGRPAGRHVRGRGAPGRHRSATSTSARPTASWRASWAGATCCRAPWSGRGASETDGGIAIACVATARRGPA